MKRMTHPQHGAHHAMNSLEEDTMRENGWTTDEDPAPAPELEPTTDEDPAPAPRPRRGRPAAADKA